MSRSVKKGPYVDAKLLKRIVEMNENGEKRVLKTWSRSSTIFPDMIGHTGNYDVTVEALEFLDKCVKDVVETALKNDYFILLTADHGNAEEMRDSSGRPQTAHSLNPVICMAIDKTRYDMIQYGGLENIAPTFIQMMGLAPNYKFEGRVLINN